MIRQWYYRLAFSGGVSAETQTSLEDVLDASFINIQVTRGRKRENERKARYPRQKIERPSDLEESTQAEIPQTNGVFKKT